MYAYIFICIIAAIMMGIYSKGDALEGSKMSAVAKYTVPGFLGNLGFINNVCFSQYYKFENSHPDLSCSKGEIKRLIHTGLRPATPKGSTE